MNKFESEAIFCQKAEMKIMERYIRSLTTTDGTNSITTVAMGPAFGPFVPPEKAPTKEKKNMQIMNNDPHFAARTRMYNRTSCDFEEHVQALRKQYHMDDTDTTNWSWEDFAKAMKDGKYVLRDSDHSKKKGSFNRYNLHGYVRFRDPDQPPQDEAYEDARDKLETAWETVLDAIVIEEPKDALKKVDAFRAKTFH